MYNLIYQKIRMLYNLYILYILYMLYMLYIFVGRLIHANDIDY